MKKIISLLLVLVMALGIFAACTPETGSGEGKYAGVEIVYWSMWNSTEPQAQVIKEAAAAFEKETGAKVTIEWKGRDIQKIISAALEQGEKIDLFDDDYQRIANTYVKYTADLTEMAKAAGYTGYECLNNQVKAWTDGKLNSIVEQPQVGGVFYNKDTFVKAGIEKAPTTWAEFLDVCAKLKAAGVAPLALDAAYTNFTYYYHLVRHLGEPAIAELAKNGGWANNDAAVKAAQEIVDLVKAGYMAEGAPDEYPSGQNKLGNGQAAMVVCANYVTAEVDGVYGAQNWGMFNYPTVEGSDNAVAYAGANSFAITSYSKNQQAAFDFIMKITTGEFDQKMADTAGHIPCDTNNTCTKLPGAIEALKASDSIMSWCDSIRAKEDLMPSFKELTAKLYAGEFESGKAFCEAMDALYN